MDLGPHAGRFEAVGVAALAATPVVALGLADGGFYPRPWGWAGVGLGLTVVTALVVRREPTASRRGLLLLCLLGALGLWIAASFAWTRSLPGSVLELERLLVYLTGVAAAVLLVSARNTRALVVGVFVGSIALTLVGVLSYLVTREGSTDLFQGSFLHRPLGYANAMAIMSVIALLLGLGLAADLSHRAERVAVAVALVPAMSALALTGSRAGYAALVLGTAAALVVAPERARLAATIGWHAPVPIVAAFIVSASDVTDAGMVGARADRLGDRLLVVLAMLAALAACAGFLASRPRETRWEPSRRWWAGAGAAVLTTLLALVLVRGVPDLAGDRPTLWGVALAEFAERPLHGSGAGTFAQVWLERRPVASSVRDAHSIVIESLSELGVVGLVLVVLLLGVPLRWALRARRHPLVPAVTGAFVAFVVHASVDWDWEMPAVTLAALFCAVMLGVSADIRVKPVRLGPLTRGMAVALAALAAVGSLAGFAGASAVEVANRALARGEPAVAERAARRAERWQPWAVDPLLTRGQALKSLGSPNAAQAVFARAAARDPNDYRVWLALATVSNDDLARASLARARVLNPRAVSWSSEP